MGAAKKYKHYPVEENTAQDKKQIDQYVKKIQERLEKEPELQKKSALIIENMINPKKKK